MRRQHEAIAASIASAAVADPDTIVKAQRGGGAAHVIAITFTRDGRGGLLVAVHGESATDTDEASRLQLGAFTGQIARYVEAMLGGAPVAVL